MSTTTEIQLETFDPWLRDDGPAALVLREHLTSIEGEDGVVFPPTFAASEDKTFKGGYNVDDHGDGSNVCLIDSHGSQANRIEPIFARDAYKALVPQIVVLAGTKRVHLLDAGHRAGDAVVRCSSLQDELRSAFKADMAGDAEPLAKLAPTSLVFGVWDSRDTQAKRPRLVSSTIRAYNVRTLHRSATFNRAVDYEDEKLATKELLEREVKGKRMDSACGMANALASWTHGGVMATGGIRRDASLQMNALRRLRAGDDATRTLALQRYILGLSLIAFTFAPPGYLRQGCNLVLDPDKGRELKAVFGDGRREASVAPGSGAALTSDVALAYAKVAACAFGVGADRDVPFSVEAAERDLKKDLPGGDKEAKKDRLKARGK
jgi:CRISPR-associated protein Csb1